MNLRRRRWKIHKSDRWHDTRTAAYRNLPDYLIKKKLLIPLAVVIELLILLFFQAIGSFCYAIISTVKQIIRNGLTNGQVNFGAAFAHSFWSFSVYFQHPMLGFFLFVVSLFFITIMVIMAYRSYAALEDRFNAGTNRFATRQEIIQQYALMPADWSRPFDDIPGLPIAHFSAKEVKKLLQNDEKRRVEPYVRYKGHVRYLDATADSEKKVQKGNEVSQQADMPQGPATDGFIAIGQEATNVCGIGITRAGKKVFLVGQAIDSFSRPRSMAKKASFIIADPKGEHCQENYKMLKARGYIIKILNLMHTFQSTPYNPFADPIKDYARWMDTNLSQEKRNEALDRAEKAIMNIAFNFYENPEAKNPMWGDNAQLLFTAIALVLIEQCIRKKQTDRVALYTTAMVLEQMSGDVINRRDHPFLKKYTKDPLKLDDLYKKYKGRTTLDVYFNQLSVDHPARALYGGIKLAGAAKETVAGIGTHVFAGLKTYIQPGIASMMARNDFDFEEIGFGDHPVAVFMIIPDQDKSNHKLATFFIDQSYKKLVDLAFDAPNEQCKRTVIYLMDEMGNLPVISDLDTKLTACLARNIRFFIILQSFSQLNKYPDGTEDTILSNCGYTFFIKSPSKSTTELISERLGKRAVLDINRTGSWFSIGKSETEMVKYVELMTVSELEELQFGENVILRIMKNDDLDGHPITAYPIQNVGPYRFRRHYEYIPQHVTSWKEMPEANHGAHRDLKLNDLLVELEPLTGAGPRKKTEGPEEPDKENVSSPVLQGARSEKTMSQLRRLHGIVSKPEAERYPCSVFWDGPAQTRLIKVIQQNSAEKGFADQAIGLLHSTAPVETFFVQLSQMDEEKGFAKVADLMEAKRKEGETAGAKNH